MGLGELKWEPHFKLLSDTYPDNTLDIYKPQPLGIRLVSTPFQYSTADVKVLLPYIKGDKGDQGEVGPQGPKGDIGPQGLKGDKGDTGNGFTEEQSTKLNELPTKTELDASLASKQPAITTSDDIAPLGADKLALTTPAKYSAFDDVWVRLCSYHGGLDYSHTENNISKPYLLNGLWLTRNEAIDIVAQYRTWGPPTEDLSHMYIRTNIPIGRSSPRDYSNSYFHIEVANLGGCMPKTLYTCFVGDEITSIINFNAKYLTRAVNSCFAAPNLVTLDISNLKINLDLSKCPLIDLTSWQGLVSRAANTDAITVTVHPDVYAKLTGDTTNAAASALSADELAQWQALIAQAAEKQITFATT